MSSKKQFVIHPLFFAIFPIVFLFSLNINSLNHEEVILPILLVPIISIGLWGLLSIVIKNKIKAGLIISIGLVVFFSYGHVHNILIESDALGDFSRHRYLLIPFFATFFIGTIYFLKTNRILDNATKITNGISITLVIMTLVNLTSFAIDDSSIISDDNQFSNLVLGETSPNVYLIILDGYAGESILNSVYDFDNSEFLDKLRQNGFHVMDNANTNYAMTTHVLSSFLNMEYMNYVGSTLGEDSKNVHPLYDLIQNNKVMNDFSSLGYDIIILGSSHKFSTEFSSADEILCQSNDNINSEFTINLFKTSILKPIYSILFESHRDKILCSLNELPQIHQKYDGPYFVFSHLLIPHPPTVFGPNGEEVEAKTIEVTDSWGDKDGYLDQVQFSNKKLLEFLDSLKQDGEDPIIIIMGDHGSGSTGLISSTKKLEERMFILNAIKLPGVDNKPYDGMTPVNSFRLVFNSYFGGDYPYLEDKMYLSQHEAPYNFTDVTSILQK